MVEVVKAGGTAGFIGIMILLFVFYILFLPPQERLKLLEPEEYNRTYGPGGTAARTTPSEAFERGVLLREFIGRLEPSGQGENSHSIPNFFLRESRNAEVLVQMASLRVYKGLFGKNFERVSFPFAEPENVNSVQLSFQAPVRSGNLRIKLNSYTVFEGKIDVANPPAIQLRNDLLQKANLFEIEVSGGFFERKEYQLKDLKIIGDVTDVSRQTATNTFVVAVRDAESLERVALQFYPACSQATAGVMTVWLNDRNVFEGVPVCESINRQELQKTDITEGVNTLVFKTDRGSFDVENIIIKTFSEKAEPFVGYYRINSTLWNQLSSGSKRIIFNTDFVDDGRTKKADVAVNGVIFAIDQKSANYTRDISSFSQQGNNYVQLTPRTSLNIVKLEVREE